MLKVLVVEDMPLWQNFYSDGVTIQLKGAVEPIPALNADEARRIFDQQMCNLSAVVMDACLRGNHPDTQVLVQHMVKSGFKGPIIAASSSQSFRTQLMTWGCTLQCRKEDVPAVIGQVLGLLHEAQGGG